MVAPVVVEVPVLVRKQVSQSPPAVNPPLAMLFVVPLDVLNAVGFNGILYVPNDGFVPRVTQAVPLLSTDPGGFGTFCNQLLKPLVMSEWRDVKKRRVVTY